jgi:hypothetical protein
MVDEWKVMPFGLCNAPSSWQRLMDLLMAGLNWHGVLIYLDDVLVFGKDFEEHYSRLREVLSRLRRANIKLSPKKCHILQKEVIYLGHVISNGEVKPDPEKTKLIDAYPVPKTISDVRSFVSLASYYRRFVKNFAHVSKPLTQMLEKGKEFHWDLDCQHAFDTIKGKLSSETRLQLPDFSKPFRLACDASGVAIGAVLSQLDEDGKEKPIAFASKVLSKTERKWTETERELFALDHFVIHFKQYLYGQPFELISDHKPLVWLRTMKNPSPKLARWLMQLEAFNFTVNYKEGAKNANADVMSRLPEHEEVPETNTLEIIDMESGISREEIRKAQEDNPLVERVMSLLDNNGIWPQTTALRPFYDKRDDLFVHEGILCRQVDDAYTQLVLLPELHERALQYFHDSPVAGHSGIDRTEKRWLQNFYWPNARKIIADYIRACPVCEKFKPSKENTKAELQPIISTHPLDLIEIDFVGPLPTSRRNFRYILSIIDHFSKFAMAIPTTRMDSGTVIDCLNNFCSEFGTPNRILSDQARNFISREFLDWCKA